MGMFSRLGDIIGSNINAMLDNAEDPEKIARLMIHEMEDTLVEVRTATARAMADRKAIQKDIADLYKARDDWEAKAELAISKDREDLARRALLAKHKTEAEIVRLEATLVVLKETCKKRQEDLGRLQAKLDEAKAQERTLKMRHEVASQRIKIREHMHDGKVDDALARYADLERKVGELESYAETIKPSTPSLKEEFEILERDEQLEKEFKALKAKHASTKGKSKS